MTSLLVLPKAAESYATSDAYHNARHRFCRNALKVTKNTHRLKCKQFLKKKLKKYKLRHDGKEDQDIIDVSDTLVSSLCIRSPDNRTDCVEQGINESRPINYLFRMVKRKQTHTPSSSLEIHSLKIDSVSNGFDNVEEKKQTNAFKLLMNSRNKIIGTNSPGKDKQIDESELEEILEKKNAKVKINLLLQKMAESKGSLKKKETEEHQEKYIKKKMEKRAERLKKMIANIEPKHEQKNILNGDISSPNSKSPLDNLDTEKNVKITNRPTNTLQLVNIFNDAVDKTVSPDRKHIPKEDEEFLKKLSPSIRKKESMLSYFKKVEKDSDISVMDSENDIAVIKVKLRHKKKSKKKLLSLNKSSKDKESALEAKTNVIIVNVDENINDTLILREENHQVHQTVTNNARKRKRKAYDSIPDCGNNLIPTQPTQTDDGRPKRTIKKPVKYNEEHCLFSSDEELLIFTPKKKKHINNAKKQVSNENIEEKSKLKNGFSQSLIAKMKPEGSPVSTKPVKLAPIFSSKTKLAAVGAKQKFLQSGVPEKLKKMIAKAKDINCEYNEFPRIVHVQQLVKMLPDHLPLRFEENIGGEFDQADEYHDNLFTKLIDMSSQSSASMQTKSTVDTKTVLKNLKETYPRFPVYRTYRLLRAKKKGEIGDGNIFLNMDNSAEILNCSIDMQNDNPDQFTWCDRYKCMSGNEIIGNFDSIVELRKWLVTWTENSAKSKVTKDSDSSDYYQSDTDSRDSFKSNNNLLILSGPVGSGKTSSVYAVAAELCIKVIEVNPSSKRTGKIMLQDLQEATQSHKVNRGTGSADNSQKSEEIVEAVPVKTKKRGRPKKHLEQPNLKKEKAKDKNSITTQTNSQDNTRTAMSLILIDDADIIFDQDDGFCAAITQLVQCSKRPVILITGSLSCPHLQKFVQCGRIIKMQPFLPNLLGTWLDIMCLVDSGKCWQGLGAKVLNYYKGDIRKTINYLQFYVCSQDQVSVDGNSLTDTQNNDIKDDADDECSSMSWANKLEDRYTNLNDNILSIDNNANEFFTINQFTNPYNIFNLWWSVPKILSLSDYDLNNKEQVNNVDKVIIKTSMECLCSVLDSISMSDYINPIRTVMDNNIASNPWSYPEFDSVSELENLEDFNENVHINEKISYNLVKGSISIAQGKMESSLKPNIDFPGMSDLRRRERIVSRHNKLTSYLSPQSSLDRKALALDYWSFCRSVCRIEKSKTDSGSKRNNRHCHYLKSLSSLCKGDIFDNLGSSLNPST